MNDELKLALQYARKGANRELEKHVFSKVRKATESVDALVDCDRTREAAKAGQALADYSHSMNRACELKKSMERALAAMPTEEISRAAEMLRNKTPVNHAYLVINPVEMLIARARNLLEHVAVAQRSEEVMKAYLK